MKEFFKTFKIIWDDERGRALIKLGIYLIFIVFVIMYTRDIYSKTQTNTSTKTVLEKYMSEKIYTEKIKINNDLYTLTNDNGSIIFEYEDNSYLVNNNVVLKKDDNMIIDHDIYFWNITPNLIGNLVKNKETYYVTKYNDGITDKAYKVSLVNFISAFNGNETDIKYLEEIPDTEFIIIVNETKDKINKVSLDLSSYYTLITGNEKQYNVEIEY